MTRRMHQRHEHLLSPLMPASHVILHNRDAACEAVFVPKPLEDPLRRMLLLLRSRLVVPENAVDYGNKWIKLRFCRRLLAHVTRRHRELHHLVHGPRINPEPPRRRPLAQPLNPNRMPYLQIEIHVLHPSPSAESRAKGYLLPDFYSGATGTPGRFSEGLLLRRLQVQSGWAEIEHTAAKDERLVMSILSRLRTSDNGSPAVKNASDAFDVAQVAATTATATEGPRDVDRLGYIDSLRGMAAIAVVY